MDSSTTRFDGAGERERTAEGREAGTRGGHRRRACGGRLLVEDGSPVMALAALLALAGAACGGAGDSQRGVQLVPGERSRPLHPDARLTIERPARGSVHADSTPRVTLRLSGFELGASTPGADARGIAMSDGGQHVHVIVDNQPYQAVYDATSPVRLAAAPLGPGVHVLRAFPSRQWHESVKSAGAFAVTHFFVGDTAGAEMETEPPYAENQPLLTYSRPKGTYEGANADSIMVDFWLRGAELGPAGHKVRLTVDDTLSWTLETWAPHYLLGLADGEHRIGLELLDADGEPVPGRLNRATRTIAVVRAEAGGAGGG